MYVVTLIGIAISTLINIKFFADLFHYFEHELPSHLMVSDGPKQAINLTQTILSG